MPIADTITETSTLSPRLRVTPSNVPPELVEYYRDAELLGHAFLVERDPDNNKELHFALQLICGWAPHDARYHDCWEGWNRRFDADMGRRIDGKVLVRYGVPNYRGPSAEELVGQMIEFVRWLGGRGRIDAVDVERLDAEMHSAAPALAKRLEREYQKQFDTPEMQVAPFVGWLLDTTHLSLEHRMLGQAMAMRALRMLRRKKLDNDRWPTLDLAALVEAFTEDCSFLGLSRRAPLRIAVELVSFLYANKLLSAEDVMRMCGAVGITPGNTRAAQRPAPTGPRQKQITNRRGARKGRKVQRQ